MNAGLLGLAVAVVAGGLLAVTARESRAAVLGVTFVAVLTPLLAIPVPAPLTLAVRIVAGLLTGYLLWAATRSGAPSRGSTIGWPAEAVVACAAAIAGGAAAGAGGGATGQRELLMAASALGVLALGPVLSGRDVLRLTVGLLLALHAVGMLRLAGGVNVSVLEQVVTAGLVVALGAAGAALAAGAARTSDGLSLEVSRRSGAHRPGAGAAPADQAGVGRPVAPRSVGARRILGR